MEENKKQLMAAISVLMMVFWGFVLTYWLAEMKFVDEQGELIVIKGIFWVYHKFKPKILFFRFFYVLLLWVFYYVLGMRKVNEKETKESMTWWMVYGILVSILIVVGTIGVYLYDLLIWPIFFFGGFYVIAKAASPWRVKITDNGLGLSCKEENDMSFDLFTDQGTLRIHAPQQGIFVEGGAGSGKSNSVVEPILEQAVQKGYSGVIYDFKGNPITLGKAIYCGMMRRVLKKDEVETKVAFISFTDLTRTVRVNPIHPDYVTSKLFAQEIAFNMMVNLQKEWREKQDFWASNAIAYVEGIIWMLKKHRPDICTIPHVVSMGLNSVETVLNYLSTDLEIEMMMKPLADAFKKNAEGQIAGVSASAQLPLKKLFTPEVFWVLSKNEISLDVNNKQKPILLCVANDPLLQESLSAALSVILTTCFKFMNQQGKHKSIIAIDELPTIFINKLDNIPATARSNKVVTFLSVQSYSQLERDYGKQNAEVILGNLGNQFVGMTNEPRTAKRVEDMLGQEKVTEISESFSDNGTSTTESRRFEKVKQAKEILGQKIGHFTGKIAGGEPAFFSAQFERYKFSDENDKVTIPQFCSIDTGNEKKNAEIINKLAMDNFEQINREVKELLEPYVTIEEK